jgi:hypothetical protein
MSSYYVVLQDMDYDNNHILFISQSEDIARKWCKKNTDIQKEQISIMHYVMSEDHMVSENSLFK